MSPRGSTCLFWLAYALFFLWRATIGRIPLGEWSARRRDLYLTTHNTHNRQTSMPPVGFEPTISAGERPKTYALDRAATRIGKCWIDGNKISASDASLLRETTRKDWIPRLQKNECFFFKFRVYLNMIAAAHVQTGLLWRVTREELINMTIILDTTHIIWFFQIQFEEGNKTREITKYHTTNKCTNCMSFISK